MPEQSFRLLLRTCYLLFISFLFGCGGVVIEPIPLSNVTFTPASLPTLAVLPAPSNTANTAPTSTVSEQPSPTITSTLPSSENESIEDAINRALIFPDNASNSDWVPFTHTFDGVEMVLVPRGCFAMGDDPLAYQNIITSPSGRSVRGVPPVNLSREAMCFQSPFWLDRFEVSQGKFIELGGAASRPNGFTGNSNLPRENLTWFEAADLCERRDGRLPSEMEWEYAARGPRNYYYPWGNLSETDDSSVSDYVIWSANSNGMTAPVGSRPQGASWVGAIDMLGNVEEWIATEYQPYETYSLDESLHTTTDPLSIRAIRGFSWRAEGFLPRAANRSYINAGNASPTIGFRCMRSIEAAQTVQAGATTEQTSSIKTVLRECTEADISSAQAGVQSNEAWVTHRCSQVFDGVEMVLVPGSTDNRIPEPFWVARNEVRVEDYVSFLNRNVDIRKQVCDSPRQYQLCWLYSADATTSDGVTGNVIISNGRFEIAPFVSGKSSVVAITFAGANAYCKSLRDSNFIIYGPQWQYVFGDSSAEDNWVNAVDMSNSIFEWTSSGLDAGNEIRDGQIQLSYTITGSRSDITFRCARLVG